MPQLLIHYVTDGIVAVATGDAQIPMEPLSDGWWSLRLGSGSDYRYVVRSASGGVVDVDPTPRTLEGGGWVIDRWMGHDSAARSRRSALFTRAVAGRYPREHPSSERVTFRLLEPDLDPDAGVTVTGNAAALGDWDPNGGVKLRPGPYPWWVGAVDIAGGDYEYKYVVAGANGWEWDVGPNRFARIPGHDPVRIDDEAMMGRPGWTGAGVAIPVFSLRTSRSLGVGQFTDLVPMIDWAVDAGFSMIQLLPVNDTRKSDDWADSYPYDPVSVFALHPLYADLDAIPGHERYATELDAARARLEPLADVAYEEVIAEKMRLLRLIHAGSDPDDPELAEFVDAEWPWLGPYSAWQSLREAHGTEHATEWGADAVFDQSRIDVMDEGELGDAMRFHWWVQFHLHRQLSAAVSHARSRGIALKGDLPIGVSPISVEVWQHPELFHLDGQAGAPPDDFAVRGQNWGFPTYNWDAMASDGYGWWRSRFAAMAATMDAYRIDHVLGFFRIWEVPADQLDGLLGHFRPCLPLSKSELRERLGDLDIQPWLRPAVDATVLERRFGDHAALVRERFFEGPPHDLRLVEDTRTQRAILDAIAAGALEQLAEETRNTVERALLDTAADVMLLEIERGFHPRISWDATEVYARLDAKTQQAFDALAIDFMHHRHSDWWMRRGRRALAAVIDATDMLACGEDLGMVPAEVPNVMRDLGLLGLEIERMPKRLGEARADPGAAPYLSVVSPGTHDMTTLRMWWEEDQAASQTYWNDVLGNSGEAPPTATPDVVAGILTRHLESPAMLCIAPLADWLGIDGELRRSDDEIAEERINVPAERHHNWQYRMHLSVEDLQAATDFTSRLRRMIQASGR